MNFKRLMKRAVGQAFIDLLKYPVYTAGLFYLISIWNHVVPPPLAVGDDVQKTVEQPAPPAPPPSLQFRDPRFAAGEGAVARDAWMDTGSLQPMQKDACTTAAAPDATIKVPAKRKTEKFGTFTGVGMQIGLAFDTVFGALFGAGEHRQE